MADTIRLTVQENGGNIPLSVQSGDRTVALSVEQTRIIEAVSPTVTLERVSDGVLITVRDLHGERSETVYDGPTGQGEPGYTPIRGVDYWTTADRQSVTQAAIDAVLAAYPAAEGVSW